MSRRDNPAPPFGDMPGFGRNHQDAYPDPRSILLATIMAAASRPTVYLKFWFTEYYDDGEELMIELRFVNTLSARKTLLGAPLATTHHHAKRFVVSQAWYGVYTEIDDGIEGTPLESWIQNANRHVEQTAFNLAMVEDILTVSLGCPTLIDRCTNLGKNRFVQEPAPEEVMRLKLSTHMKTFLTMDRGSSLTNGSLTSIIEAVDSIMSQDTAVNRISPPNMAEHRTSDNSTFRDLHRDSSNVMIMSSKVYSRLKTQKCYVYPLCNEAVIALQLENAYKQVNDDTLFWNFPPAYYTDVIDTSNGGGHVCIVAPPLEKEGVKEDLLLGRYFTGMVGYFDMLKMARCSLTDYHTGVKSVVHELYPHEAMPYVKALGGCESAYALILKYGDLWRQSMYLPSNEGTDVVNQMCTLNEEYLDLMANLHATTTLPQMYAVALAFCNGQDDSFILQVLRETVSACFAHLHALDVYRILLKAIASHICRNSALFGMRNTTVADVVRSYQFSTAAFFFIEYIQFIDGTKPCYLTTKEYTTMVTLGMFFFTDDKHPSRMFLDPGILTDFVENHATYLATPAAALNPFSAVITYPTNRYAQAALTAQADPADVLVGLLNNTFHSPLDAATHNNIRLSTPYDGTVDTIEELARSLMDPGAGNINTESFMAIPHMTPSGNEDFKPPDCLSLDINRGVTASSCSKFFTAVTPVLTDTIRCNLHQLLLCMETAKQTPLNTAACFNFGNTEIADNVLITPTLLETRYVMLARPQIRLYAFDLLVGRGGQIGLFIHGNIRTYDVSRPDAAKKTRAVIQRFKSIMTEGRNAILVNAVKADMWGEGCAAKLKVTTSPAFKYGAYDSNGIHKTPLFGQFYYGSNRTAAASMNSFPHTHQITNADYYDMASYREPGLGDDVLKYYITCSQEDLMTYTPPDVIYSTGQIEDKTLSAPLPDTFCIFPATLVQKFRTRFKCPVANAVTTGRVCNGTYPPNAGDITIDAMTNRDSNYNLLMMPCPVTYTCYTGEQHQNIESTTWQSGPFGYSDKSLRDTFSMTPFI